MFKKFKLNLKKCIKQKFKHFYSFKIDTNCLTALFGAQYT